MEVPQVINDPEMMIVSEEEVSDEEVIQPVPKENINTDDVFSKSSKKKVSIAEGEPVIKKVKMEVKKKGKARKPLSEEHKAKLAEARKLALEKRRANAAEKKKLKELEKQANEKTKAKKKKELEDIVNEVEPEPAPPPQPVKAEVDPAIIQKAIDEALLKSEMARQERKRIKKAKMDEEVKRKKAEEEIKKVVYPPTKLYYGEQGFISKSIYNLQ
tara:strand:- start:236 stop:880 length:645 start_codon:yes stop_codon:yes gene_type:complete